MAAPSTAARQPRSQRPSPGPGLRVVGPTPSPVGTRRRARVAVAAGLTLAVGLLAVVASHVVLAQGQFRLQRLEARAAVEQARYERLRLRVAELESPSRVVAAAQERLGMVPPPGVTYLSPTGAASGRATPPPRRDGEQSATEDWARVKRQLTKP